MMQSAAQGATRGAAQAPRSEHHAGEPSMSESEAPSAAQPSAGASAAAAAPLLSHWAEGGEAAPVQRKPAAGEALQLAAAKPATKKGPPRQQVLNAIKQLQQQDAVLGKIHRQYDDAQRAIQALAAEVDKTATDAEFWAAIKGEMNLQLGRLATGVQVILSGNPQAAYTRVMAASRGLSNEVFNAAGMDATGNTIFTALTTFNPASPKDLFGPLLSVAQIAGAWNTQYAQKNAAGLRAQADQLFAQKTSIIHACAPLRSTRFQIGQVVKALRQAATRLPA